MITAYLEYIKNLNNSLIRAGIRLPLNLTEEYESLFQSLNILEGYLDFNRVMRICDSNYKITTSGTDSKDLYSDILKDQIYSEYCVSFEKAVALLYAETPDTLKESGEEKKPILKLTNFLKNQYTDENSTGTVVTEDEGLKALQNEYLSATEQFMQNLNIGVIEESLGSDFDNTIEEADDTEYFIDDVDAEVPQVENTWDEYDSNDENSDDEEEVDSFDFDTTEDEDEDDEEVESFDFDEPDEEEGSSGDADDEEYDINLNNLDDTAEDSATDNSSEFDEYDSNEDNADFGDFNEEEDDADFGDFDVLEESIEDEEDAESEFGVFDNEEDSSEEEDASDAEFGTFDEEEEEDSEADFGVFDEEEESEEDGDADFGIFDEEDAEADFGDFSTDGEDEDDADFGDFNTEEDDEDADFDDLAVEGNYSTQLSSDEEEDDEDYNIDIGIEEEEEDDADFGDFKDDEEDSLDSYEEFEDFADEDFNDVPFGSNNQASAPPFGNSSNPSSGVDLSNKVNYSKKDDDVLLADALVDKADKLLKWGMGKLGKDNK